MIQSRINLVRDPTAESVGRPPKRAKFKSSIALAEEDALE